MPRLVSEMDLFSRQFFGWFFPFLSMTGYSLLWLAWKRGTASVNWPTTMGEILRSEIRRTSDSRDLVIEYCYWVNGTEYHGDTPTYRGYSNTTAVLEEYTTRFPIGTRVEVHYDPQDPVVSVLETGANATAYLGAAALLAIFLVIGILMKVGVLG